ncbi:TPA: dCTP deaminase [Serratia marcescens]|nr:dCTP deaminase [Serratia marcescens]
MILTGKSIEAFVRNGDIAISPFSTNHITTNSYDLTLGSRFIRYREEVMDPKKENSHDIIECGAEGIMLNKGDFVLAHSIEKLGSNKYVPIIHAKSSIARLGLFVHVTADLIDIGSFGCVTFQLHSTLPIRLFPGMKIGQVTFWKPLGDIIPYNGKYQGSEGPRVSLAYADFKQ